MSNSASKSTASGGASTDTVSGTGSERGVSTAVAFYVAAKRAEIASLRQLVSSCELVTRVTDLIHELQRERGLSNVVLQSRGERFVAQRQEQILRSQQVEQQLRDYLLGLDIERGALSGKARLFNNLAYVVHALDELPQLRARIDRQAVSATDSTQILSRLIGGLLAVLFEAADISCDPDITRVLVALFNFMQGKEYAGQERAWGAIGFAAGGFEAQQLERLASLLDSQQHSFEIFAQFSEPDQRAGWEAIEAADSTQELRRLRAVFSRLESGAALPPAISEVWYELTTWRIDAMQRLERQLSQTLAALSSARLQQAQKELKYQQTNLQQLDASVSPPAPVLESRDPDYLNEPGKPELVRSLYDLLQHQGERLQRMGDELTEARQALTERKQVERAKGLLMQYQGISEEQAYAMMRQSAMQSGRSLLEVAESVIDGVKRSGRL